MISAALPTAVFGSLGSVCRLGLASRGTSQLSAADVRFAIERGVNFLNWPGSPDALGEAIVELGTNRPDVKVCVQLEARTAADAQRELAAILRTLRRDHVDVLTFYYVETAAEWQEIIGPAGALEFCRRAKEQGQVRMLGVTSHQRRLAAEIARSGLVDMLMIRYNAAHRGAESDIFPITTMRHMPVVSYTSLRWGALLGSTQDDPPGFRPPPAPEWYRFVLQNPAVTVALMAPETRHELAENLAVLSSWQPLDETAFRRLAAHGQRVRRQAGSFP